MKKRDTPALFILLSISSSIDADVLVANCCLELVYSSRHPNIILTRQRDYMNRLPHASATHLITLLTDKTRKRQNEETQTLYLCGELFILRSKPPKKPRNLHFFLLEDVDEMVQRREDCQLFSFSSDYFVV